MEKLLLEEIERYKRLSFYNPKLTLTENTEISEAGFSPASTAREVESAIGKDLQSVMRDYKIAEMSVADVTKLLEKDAKSFEKELSKAFEKDIKSGYPKGTLGPAGKNLSKVDLLRRMASDSKSLGRPLNPQEIESLIKEVASENKIKAAKFEPKPVEPKKPSPAEEDAWEREPSPDKKKWNWKKMLKWGAVAGVSAGALYYIYKKTHGEEPPVPVPPVPVPPVPPTPNPSQYHSCPDTFPIAKFCKNNTVKKVQGCLGVTADGLFGPKTQGALESKGVDGTSITQQTVDKVCNNNTSQVNPDIEDVDGQDPNTI